MARLSRVQVEIRQAHRYKNWLKPALATQRRLWCGIGQALGLPARIAVLLACGNAICGNTAMAAVASVIGADGRDVASSIAFTAVQLGLSLMLLRALPLA